MTLSIAGTQSRTTWRVLALAFGLGSCVMPLLLLGCASDYRTVSLPAGELARLTAAPVILSPTHSPRTTFLLNGGWKMEDARQGAMLAARYELVDPVSRLQARVLDLLASTRGLTNVRRAEGTTADDDLPALKTLFGDALVLSFRTLWWGLADRNVSIIYNVRVRLLDLRASTVLWQGVCRTRGRDLNPYALTAQGEPLLLANNAALLKQELADAADLCALDLLRQFPGGPGGLL